jgi:hypothetical protein
MKNILAALILITLPASRALAGAGCQTTTGGSGIVLEKIRQNATGPELFGCINRSFDVLASSGVPTRSTNSWLVEGRIDVSTIGATTNVPAVYFSSAVTVSSTLTVQGNTFSVGGSSFTVTGGTAAVAYRLTAGSLGLGGAPSGTRKFQVYFNANNNSPSYGDGAVRYLDSVNGVGFECGALYGGSQPSWCQSGNDGMGSKKPFVFQPDGSNVGIRTLSPATTAALEVAGPVSVGGSGNTQYSLQASSGASFGSDVHVIGTLEATKLKGDGSQITGIGGGGTVTTQGSPAAGYMAAFQGSSAISTAPYYVTPDSMTALVPVSFSTGVNIAQYAKFSSSAPSASMGAGAMWLDSSSGRINYLDANNLQIELDPAVVFATTYSTGTVTRAIGPPSNDKLCFTPGHHSFSDGTPGLGCADALGGLPFGISGTVKRLTCWHSSALGASNTWTLRKNGSSTGNACTDSAIAASCSVSESLVIVSTDIVSVQQTAGATLTNGGCMIAVVPGVQ